MKSVINAIREQGFVSNTIRTNELKHLNIFEIRNWLESNGFSRHLAIECVSTEIAICTPKGVLMQVRSSDNQSLGMWGGVVDPGESPTECAIRELVEETGIHARVEELEFVDMDNHNHTYANGNKSIFHAHRYLLKLNYVPHVHINYESTGSYIISSEKDVERVLEHQREFILNLIKSMQESS